MPVGMAGWNRWSSGTGSAGRNRAERRRVWEGSGTLGGGGPENVKRGGEGRKYYESLVVKPDHFSKGGKVRGNMVAARLLQKIAVTDLEKRWKNGGLSQEGGECFFAIHRKRTRKQSQGNSPLRGEEKSFRVWGRKHKTRFVH